MGGWRVSVGLVGTPHDDGALASLHREVWGLVAARIKSLASRRTSRDTMSVYLSGESSDGFRSGTWCASPDRLRYWFADGGGRAAEQMDVAVHWTELALLDQWSAIQAAGAAHGVELVLPGRALSDRSEAVPELDARLAGRSEQILLGYRGKLMRTSPGDDVGGTCLWAVRGTEEVMLSAVVDVDRAWITELIREGRCGCEPCQRLRAARGMRLAPQPARGRRPSRPAPLSDTPPPRYQLASAPVLEYGQAKRHRSDPAEVVALNLAATSLTRAPASFLTRLPRYPLRALNLRSHGLRGVPPGVLACRELRVLSLRRCRMRQPLADGLRGLTKLLALDVTDNYYQGLLSPAVFALTGLEILDYFAWDRELPREVFSLPRLRHLDLRALNRLPAELADLPLESLVVSGGYDPGLLARLPLRYLELSGTDRPMPDCPTLEHLALTYPGPGLPAALRAGPPLRGLQITRDVRRLPAWLADAHPGLEVLRVDSDALGEQPDAFRVIERLTNLRVLVLHGGWTTTTMPLDLSGLRQLEVLAVAGGQLTRAADLPRGLDTLPSLRTFVHNARLDDKDAAELRASVPSATFNPSGPWQFEPLSLYRATQPRGTVDWYLARFAESDWVDLPTLT